MALRGAAFLLAVVVLMGSLQGCSPKDSKDEKVTAPPGGVLLRGAGATFPSWLYKRWFEIYHNDHPRTAIVYDSVGSGEGIRRFIGRNVKEEELVDFGASDAAMKDEDIAQVPNGVLLLPVTAGSVVLAYNLPDLEGDLKLSRNAYTGIFLGEIKKWNDPAIAKTNPGAKLLKLSIATVVRQDSSGTTYAFTKHLDAISEKWRAQHGPATLVNWPGNAMRAKGNEGVAARINQSIGSIGYVSYEFARKLGLKLAVLENKEGKFVKPTEQSCTAALSATEMPDNLRVFVPDPAGQNSYPIVTFSWILLYKNYPDAEKAKSVRDLFQWCLLDGQKYAPQLGYVRLPENVTGKIRAALNTIGPRERQ
ncbi:MAG: phosphate ABC transporter substrate-binding protein PstS [Nitrospirae bacterium]|nr:phosphate ABC transporter substrate-binding protein PstS [Nitrospirota bacterium]